VLLNASTAGTWPAARSPRRTSGSGPPWSGSTRSTTATSSATGTSSPRCRCCGPTPGTCSGLPASATRSTSSRPNSITTACTPASTRPGSSRPGLTSPAGSPRITGRNWAGGRSATERRQVRRHPWSRVAGGPGR